MKNLALTTLINANNRVNLIVAVQIAVALGILLTSLFAPEAAAACSSLGGGGCQGG